MAEQKKPILVLQTLRMGDLVMSFPLMLWLSRQYPGHPVWVAAEEMFSRHIMPIGPNVVYFGWDDAALRHLRQQSFHLVVNLSYDARAARLAHDLRADETLGPVQSADGSHYVRGAWQLYRTTLVGGNRHNLFHWADLNALDCVPTSLMGSTHWPAPRTLTPESQRTVGLFLGASDALKRPDAAFWIRLARHLLDRGMRPILLGGPAEKALAAEVAKGLPATLLNLAGTLSLSELVYTGQAMGLLITPDTGPMHLAAWSGLRTLNLSMGNVSAWETGPYQPGHYVVRRRMSCVGCWECTRPGPCCKDGMRARDIAVIAHRIATRGGARLDSLRFAGLEVLRTAHTADGLYDLRPVLKDHTPTTRELVSRFWRAFWGERFGAWDDGRAARAYAELAAAAPRVREAMAASVVGFSRDLGPALRDGARLDAGFWKASIPAMLPLRSWCQMHLANSDWSRPAFRECLEAAEHLIALDEPYRSRADAAR
ncbi:glycosyltransferase family 9 protein [Desulfobaculum senezii]|jgi:ADP-heptose:LPS heptosyltransferase